MKWVETEDGMVEVIVKWEGCVMCGVVLEKEKGGVLDGWWEG